MSILDGGALSGERYRVIVSTDIGGSDPDDFQSMVHYLLYSDLFDTEGLISSPWGEGTVKDIFEVIDKYEIDFPNLHSYSADYPTPNYLRSVTKQGVIDIAPYKGYSKSTEGSDWIIKCAKKKDSRPLYILAWGLLEDLAQALHDEPSIIEKIRVYYIGGPNKKWGLNAYEYIRENFPDLWIIENNSTYRGWFVGGNQGRDLGNETFVSSHALGHGALGNYFAEHLGGVIKMGDTPSVAYLLRGTPECPEKPSWGGRYVKVNNRPKYIYRRNTKLRDIVEVFGVLELIYNGPDLGTAMDKSVFSLVVQDQEFEGFYCGNGEYKVRFMPKSTGIWSYFIKSELPELNGQSGLFTCVEETNECRESDREHYANWWSDILCSEYSEQQHKGAKTVSMWREEFLRNFQDRFARCRGCKDMVYITNPILPGFNPDPSIVRVGDDYYIATSTFEWFPGVQIHHSKDLVNWKLINHPLKRLSQLDMKGNPSSGGVWAPCLTYDNGTFYLIYTDVKCHTGIFKDTHNYLVVSKDIKGEWSDPIYLNSSGFDPSLFHNDDGRKYLVNMSWDFRKGKNRFSGILIQEYSIDEKKLIGEVHNIFKGTEQGFTEGPHIYKKDGYYYLLTAEGGTSFDHAVTLARSKNIYGPYEVHPDNPILTSKGKPELILQKAGHADLVETQNGEWYLVHLCGRPLPNGRCILGRETSIQKMVWNEDGWLRLEAGGNSPLVKVPAPNLAQYKFKELPERDDFNNPELDINFSSLRIPLTKENLSLTERPGFLRLKGRESLSSKHNQSIIARRQQKFSYTATTCLEFEPDNYKQMAGLICLYDVQNFYYLRVTHNEEQGKCIGIISSINNKFDEPLDNDVSIEGVNRIYLRVVVNYEKLNFYYSIDEKLWIHLGETFDASTLSDEFCKEGCFTGAFVGLSCQDLNGTGKAADFDYFEYE